MLSFKELRELNLELLEGNVSAFCVVRHECMDPHTRQRW